MKQVVLVVVLAAAALAACKQGKGDRCQVNSDCADGLVCKAATGTCDSSTETGIDAAIPPQVDAAVDAKVFLDAP
ncbi:MAG TPA: hypothetical protein VMJ10_36830 [Kofleriaceae bacterium]|nr:hypothetical protein [Kofleriaceae bacterium]